METTIGSKTVEKGTQITSITSRRTSKPSSCFHPDPESLVLKHHHHTSQFVRLVLEPMSVGIVYG